MVTLHFAPLLLAGLIIAVGYVVVRLIPRNRVLARFLCQVIPFIGYTVTLRAAGIVPSAPTPAVGQASTFIIFSVFKLVWWLAFAWLVVGFVHAVFLRQLRETRLAQDLIAGIAYTCTTVAIIAYVFNLPVQGLLTASGIIAIVLGLALQSTLGDVFSGIMLNISKPCRPGDWVILDDGLQGRVIETSWRSTQILTENNDMAAVPNSLIAKGKLINVSHPSTAHGVTIIVRLEPVMAPARECAILETALLGCNKILRAPPPCVSIRALNALALECELQFFVAAIEESAEAQNEVFDLVHRHCAAAGIRLAAPPESPVMLPVRSARETPESRARRLLERLPLFASLSEEERAALAPRMTHRTYKSGEIVAESGNVAASLSIVSNGVLVALQDGGPGAGEVEVVRLGPGDCFGQAGVLTGAPAAFKIKALTRAAAYEIRREDLAPILKERPGVAVELGHILSQRTALSERLAEQPSQKAVPGKDLAERLTTRIRALFGLD